MDNDDIPFLQLDFAAPSGVFKVADVSLEQAASVACWNCQANEFKPCNDPYALPGMVAASLCYERLEIAARYYGGVYDTQKDQRERAERNSSAQSKRQRSMFKGRF